jgi:hypothetical protein
MTIATSTVALAAVVMCDCSDLQLDLVGCACQGEPRRRPTYAERVAEQDRVANALIERAYDRDQRAEAAYWEAEFAKDQARGNEWDPAFGEQPYDQHVRDHLTRIERVEAILIAA